MFMTLLYVCLFIPFHYMYIGLYINYNSQLYVGLLSCFGLAEYYEHLTKCHGNILQTKYTFNTNMFCIISQSFMVTYLLFILLINRLESLIANSSLL